MNIPFDSRPIIVIGMHRSGTSLLTRMLRKKGVYMGRDFDPNSEDGFFKGLNARIMNSLHATWSYPAGMMNITDMFIDAAEISIRKHISRYDYRYTGKRYRIFRLNDKSFESKFWGWKDPVNTFTLPIWRRIFPDAIVVHIYRNPIDVARSLQKRNEQLAKNFKLEEALCSRTQIDSVFHVFDNKYYDIENGIELWRKYVTKCLSYSNVLHIRYEDFLLNPDKYISQILRTDENKPVGKIQKIDKDRRFAFVRDRNLVEVYKRIQNDELLMQLQYHDIC